MPRPLAAALLALVACGESESARCSRLTVSGGSDREELLSFAPGDRVGRIRLEGRRRSRQGAGAAGSSQRFRPPRGLGTGSRLGTGRPYREGSSRPRRRPAARRRRGSWLVLDLGGPIAGQATGLPQMHAWQLRTSPRAPRCSPPRSRRLARNLSGTNSLARLNGWARSCQERRASSSRTTASAPCRRSRLAGSFSQPLAPEGCGSGTATAFPSG
jgi:hypothetical protein